MHPPFFVYLRFTITDIERVHKIPKMNIIIISFHGGINVNNGNCLKIVIFQLHVLLIQRLLTVSVRVNFAFCASVHLPRTESTLASQSFGKFVFHIEYDSFK